MVAVLPALRAAIHSPRQVGVGAPYGAVGCHPCKAGCHQIRRTLFIQFTLQRCQKSRCDAIGARGGEGGLEALGARDTDS